MQPRRACCRYPGSLRVAIIAASIAVLAGKADRAGQLLAAAPAAASRGEGSATAEGYAQDVPATWLPLMQGELAAREGNYQKVTAATLHRLHKSPGFWVSILPGATF